MTSTSKPARTAVALALTGLFMAACSGDAADEAKKEGGGEATSASGAAQQSGEKPVAAEAVTTPSGLKYEVITPGTGKQPTLSDRVTVHYRGTLTNGQEFDSSYRRGSPATFPVSGVIKGWTEALQLMKEGAKYKLTIPPDLAYGSRGAGSVIGPNETLLFEVELIKVN
jgi:FKBP-type peptidyl-prolyl cis-trans isomerase FklB